MDTCVVGRVVGKAALFSDDTEVGMMVYLNWGPELLASIFDPGVIEDNLFICEVWE